MAKVIIQIPCYNEARAIGVALSHLPRAIAGFDAVEWLTIDDGSSSDSTVEEAVAHAVNGGPAVEMERSARIDALVAKLHLRYPDRSVYWTPPRDSAHIWAAPAARSRARRAPHHDPSGGRIRPGARSEQVDRGDAVSAGRAQHPGGGRNPEKLPERHCRIAGMPGTGDTRLRGSLALPNGSCSMLCRDRILSHSRPDRGASRDTASRNPGRAARLDRYSSSGAGCRTT